MWRRETGRWEEISAVEGLCEGLFQKQEQYHFLKRLCFLFFVSFFVEVWVCWVLLGALCAPRDPDF